MAATSCLQARPHRLSAARSVFWWDGACAAHSHCLHSARTFWAATEPRVLTSFPLMWSFIRTPDWIEWRKALSALSGCWGWAQQ